MVVAGRYGLASKEFTPGMAIGIFDNLAASKPRSHFTIGIVDDVSHSHLAYPEGVNTVPVGTQQCMFWGMGSDGTVGANKEAIKIIADNTPLFTQVRAHQLVEFGNHMGFVPSLGMNNLSSGAAGMIVFQRR